MGKYDTSIQSAEQQIERMKGQIASYRKYKIPGWDKIVDSLTRQIKDKQKAIADMKKRNK